MINVWDRLMDEYSTYPTDFGGNLDNMDEIDDAEDALGIAFSDDYRKFIGLYGCGMFDGHFVHGLKKQRSMDDHNWSVVDKTNFYKCAQKWPDIDEWYVISDDGRGNPIGCKPDGSVWLSDHDAGFEQVKLADNFEEFLEKLLNDSLYE